MNTPFDISIIIPVYNCENYIEDCIKSLLLQKKISTEIIFINDGSTDNSKSIIEKYKKQYDNIVLINQENQGAATARNRGIEIASGTYILFVDADDIVIEDSLCQLLHDANKDYIEILQLTNYINYNNSQRKIRKIHSIKETTNGINYFKTMQRKRCLIAGTFNHLIRTEYLKGLPFRFDANLRRCQDLEFFIKAILSAKYIRNYNNPYYIYNTNTPTGGSESRNNHILLFECYDIIRKNFEHFANQKHLGQEINTRLDYLICTHIYGYDNSILDSLPEPTRTFWIKFVLKYIFYNKGWLRPWLWKKYFQLKNML